MQTLCTRTSIGIVLLAAATLNACGGKQAGPALDEVPRELAFVGPWEWEVPSEGSRGTLRIHARTSAATHDTLITSTGIVIECSDIMRGGRLRCGPYLIRVRGDGLDGTFQRCVETLVTVDRVVFVDPVTGEVTRESAREPRRTCTPVVMRLWRRTPPDPTSPLSPLR